MQVFEVRTKDIEEINNQRLVSIQSGNILRLRVFLVFTQKRVRKHRNPIEQKIIL